MLAGIHYFGAFLLLAATALLLVTTITAPVVDSLAILKVQLSGLSSVGSEVTFGTFGWCIIDGNGNGDNSCSDVAIGYMPTDAIDWTDSTVFSEHVQDTARVLTKVMILHPIACGLCFIGAVLGFGSGIFGSFLASLMGLVAFLATLVALVCDFVLFTILRNEINNNTTNAQAKYSVGIWTLLAGAVCAALASVILFVTCCFGRSKHHRESKLGMQQTQRPWHRWS